MNGTNSQPAGERREERRQDRREGPLRILAGYRWAEYLIAILGGNIIYLFIEPQLPQVFRHRLFRVDLGLAVDFFICALAYALVRQFRGIREDRD